MSFQLWQAIQPLRVWSSLLSSCHCFPVRAQPPAGGRPKRKTRVGQTDFQDLISGAPTSFPAGLVLSFLQNSKASSHSYWLIHSSDTFLTWLLACKGGSVKSAPGLTSSSREVQSGVSLLHAAGPHKRPWKKKCVKTTKPFPSGRSRMLPQRRWGEGCFCQQQGNWGEYTATVPGTSWSGFQEVRLPALKEIQKFPMKEVGIAGVLTNAGLSKAEPKEWEMSCRAPWGVDRRTRRGGRVAKQAIQSGFKNPTFKNLQIMWVKINHWFSM